MFKNVFNKYKYDLNGLSESEYKEIKQYIKMVYDIDSFYLKPIKISQEVLIY